MSLQNALCPVRFTKFCFRTICRGVAPFAAQALSYLALRTRLDNLPRALPLKKQVIFRAIRCVSVAPRLRAPMSECHVPVE
jgi:hypothetical protein